MKKPNPLQIIQVNKLLEVFSARFLVDVTPFIPTGK